MNSRIKDIHVIAMYILAVVGIFMIILSSVDSLWINLLISFLWLCSFTARTLFPYSTQREKTIAVITYVTELTLLSILILHGAGTATKLLFCLTMADFFIKYSAMLSTVFGMCSFMAYFSQFIINESVSTKVLLQNFGREAPMFLFVGLIAYLFGKVIKSNELAQQSMKEVQLREVELKEAYNEIKKAYKNLGEMAAVQERNRIAREIHDTVGHTITTVIVELEAGRMLAAGNRELAFEKFLLAQKQASRALDELRRSVRLLAANESEKSGFIQTINMIIEETSLHVGVNIKSDIKVTTPVKAGSAELIVHALKEGLSNGIRHGKGTAFFVKLWEEDSRLNFLLQDNGRGCENIELGFGLENMSKAVSEAGGSIELNSESGEGFEIKIALPD